jgi:hypothetical protein
MDEELNIPIISNPEDVEKIRKEVENGKNLVPPPAGTPDNIYGEVPSGNYFTPISTPAHPPTTPPPPEPKKGA